MRKRDSREMRIIILAYLHRYVYPILVFLLPMLFRKLLGEAAFLAIGIGVVLFALYTFVGYRCRWKHIYCSYQNAYRQKMTPYRIRWYTIKKSDAYGVPLVFGILGVAMIIAYFFCL